MKSNLVSFFSGATENRTRDTRIFSPLLYQLSYGTNTVIIPDCGCKDTCFFILRKFLAKNNAHLSKKSHTFAPVKPTQSECSAVGSALRSGRRGRAFESPHSDLRTEAQYKTSFCSFLQFERPTPCSLWRTKTTTAARSAGVRVASFRLGNPKQDTPRL